MVAAASCPTDSEIAAFLDGALKGEDRDRVVHHLNACPDCYALFVETAEILDDCGTSRKDVPPTPPPARGEAKILQHRKREAGSFRRLGLPLAAMLVAVAAGYLALGAWVNRMPVAAKLALSLPPGEIEPLAAKAKDEIFPSPSRGLEEAGLLSSGQEFELGIWLAFYDLFQKAGDHATLDKNVHPRIVGTLGDAGDFFPSCQPLLRRGRETPAPSLSDTQRREVLAACIATLRAELGQSPDFLLGQWAQNARIAILGDHLGFFGPDGARVPSWRLRQEGSWLRVFGGPGSPLPPDVAPILETLDTLVGDGVTPAEKELVDKKLVELIETYEAAGE